MTARSLRLHRRAGPCAVVMLGVLGAWIGCATGPAAPGSGEAGAFVGSTRDAALPPAAPTTCGDAACPEPTEDPLDVRACCLPSGGCGLRAQRLETGCFRGSQPGTVDLACPTLHLTGSLDVQGCCTPQGTCGHFDRFGELGCIAPTPSEASVSCTYVSAIECRAVVEVPCDGPEDCGPERVCCGRSALGVYDAFGCFDSCGAQSNGEHGLWVEICHPGAPCEDARSTCGPANGLPTFLARCSNQGSSEGGVRDAGTPSPSSPGVACGTSPCRMGNKCCVRTPGDPYCAPLGSPCSCAGETQVARASNGADASDGGDGGDASDASATSR